MSIGKCYSKRTIEHKQAFNPNHRKDHDKHKRRIREVAEREEKIGPRN